MPPKNNPRSPIEADEITVSCFMFCDYARIDNDKLHVLGGGWSQIQPDYFPQEIDVMLALKMAVPVEIAREPLSLQVLLGSIPATDGETPYKTEWSSVSLDLPPATPDDQGAKLVNVLATMAISMRVSRPERNIALLQMGDTELARFFFRIIQPDNWSVTDLANKADQAPSGLKE